MRTLALLIIILISISCNQDKKSEFSLNGTTQEIENGTVLYLVNSSTEEIIDSIQITNNNFHFSTDLPFHPIRATLKNKDNSLYKSLWLENNSMSFNASNQNFENAVITGSNSETEYTNLYKTADTLPRKEREKLLMDFIKHHSDDMLGPYVLSEWYISWKKEITEPLFQMFSEKNKNSLYGKEILKYIELNQNPTVGEKYVDFELTDQYDKQIKFSNLKGKLVLLEFWASWCSPCRKDNKHLVAYYKKFNPLGLEIFQVSLDSNKEKWLEAINQDSLQWTNASDLKSWNNQAAMIYGINLLPTNFLIDENGMIINRDLRGQELVQKLTEILE